MSDLAINLLASAIAAFSVWLVQRVLRYRSQAQIQEFFGLRAGSTALLIVSKQAQSEWLTSVEKADVAAMVELAVLLKSCNVTPRFYMHHDQVSGVGEEVEFCIGGPGANKRTAAHLRWHLPGVHQSSFEQDPDGVTLHVGARKFVRKRNEVDYALVARVYIDKKSLPIFIISGQTALANEGAARYLANERKFLQKKYGESHNFCFVLGLYGRGVYGSHFVRHVADVTKSAFELPADHAETAAVDDAGRDGRSDGPP